MNRTRTENINIQRLKGAETNTIKGILTFIKSKNKKKDLLHNNIIDELVNNGYYELIYNKYILNQEVDDEDIPYKDVSILEMFDFCEPIDLKEKYKGFYVKTI
jgi:hypothetical protein